ncbi:hypothetical protein BGX27_010609 [Mortierella sp. AM989]|nr:hypothetical protein BGX27_010609 [Mortierella sp. AM989]
MLEQFFVNEEDSASEEKLAKGLNYLETSNSLDHILKYYKTLYRDEILGSKLDKNPNLLVVKNGVIDLQTGECRGGRPSDYMSRQLDTNFIGLDARTPIIDDFIGDLFNHDQEAIAYFQRLMGYSITGSTESQVWVMFTGEGSNGKSLLARFLKSLLQGWVVAAPHEIFFKAQRGHAGAHTTHLLPLKGRRICIKEEAEPTDELNTEILKMITGGGDIPMRVAYAKEYEEFETQALPILLCNDRPSVNIEDYAMMRRIVVVPFQNIYTSPDDPKHPYDPNNPRHRPRDPEKAAKLLQEQGREQLLVWLVKGAMAWYKNKNLKEQPALMKQAFESYNDENDKLKKFIQMFCVEGGSYYVNSVVFREQFTKTMGIIVPHNKLVEMMSARGFNFSSTRDKHNTKIKIYRGLCFFDSLHEFSNQ